MPAVLEQPEGLASCSTAAGHRLVENFGEMCLETKDSVYSYYLICLCLGQVELSLVLENKQLSCPIVYVALYLLRLIKCDTQMHLYTNKGPK